MAFEAVNKMHADGDLPAELGADQLADQYITAAKKGILKTISKMGISTLRSYHAAQQFEAIGLDHDVVRQYFTGTASRIEGIGLDTIAARGPGTASGGLRPRATPRRLDLDFGGEYHFRLDGENHLWNPTRSPGSSTPWCRTTRKPTPIMPGRSTNRGAICARSAGFSN